MTLHGHSIIAGKVTRSESGVTFLPVNPSTGADLAPPVHEASLELADQALAAADEAFDALRSKSPAERAAFLDAIADGIEALGDALLERAQAETGLPLARLAGERSRTTGQARLFARLIREGSWQEARIDRAIPDRQPLAKPDVRRFMQPVGPVVVFGASNFPLAISVAGTDTVSALAAGCPVVVKAHPGHPGTCEMIARVISEAADRAGMPSGTFSMVHGRGVEIGMALVKHPLTTAVAFTGSLRGGRALFDAASARPSPIPFYGELGSVNPVFLLPGALQQRGPQIAESFVGSLTMGVGQFCTNPGVVFGVKGDGFQDFTEKTASLVRAWPPSTMLHFGISQAFKDGLKRISSVKGIDLLGMSEGTARGNSAQASAMVFSTDLETYRANEDLHEEVFGPASIVTQCQSREELEQVAESLQGQLTASIHGTAEDLREHARLIRILERKVGRIIFNGFGTGIEVCPAMHHGGPYPSSTHSFFTSIGTAAIYRFVRPVCYQGFPDECLPAPLQNANPAGMWRMVDGAMTQESLN
ncbi:aldehyde dehydrogenase (NADP(+)) [Verrucomicrobium spinosum]|uniref:aldehyde dehydrogenase (NADP(+)) n=1 Tax=Verrucomicrobium spinosum TaxID=2736 RepID=UPI00017455C0|nr:aldehyde dehydrogenase (NADP(+)) [Verrucomicrobium spinosum]